MSSYLDNFFDQRKAARELKTQEKADKARQQTLEDQRQRYINFKKFFGGDHGKDVLMDLMNKFYVLDPLPDTIDPLALARAEGNREVVLYILKRANMDIATLDKLLKGEFV